MNKNLFRLACALLAIAVVNGAFGAHMLKTLLNPTQLQAWQTAVLYQFIHALGILVLSGSSGLIDFNPKRVRLAGYLLAAGIVLFSGSLYLLTTQDLIGWHMGFLGPVTPAGGVLFIAGWLLAMFSLHKSSENAR